MGEVRAGHHQGAPSGEDRVQRPAEAVAEAGIGVPHHGQQVGRAGEEHLGEGELHLHRVLALVDGAAEGEVRVGVDEGAGGGVHAGHAQGGAVASVGPDGDAREARVRVVGPQDDDDVVVSTRGAGPGVGRHLAGVDPAGVRGQEAQGRLARAGDGVGQEGADGRLGARGLGRVEASGHGGRSDPRRLRAGRRGAASHAEGQGRGGEQAGGAADRLHRIESRVSHGALLACQFQTPAMASPQWAQRPPSRW